MKKTLSFEECKKHHHDMWVWLAENPRKSKREWPKWSSVGLIDMDVYVKFHWCFACLYCRLTCDKCPIKWTTKENEQFCYCSCCCSKPSYYNKWGTYMKSYTLIHGTRVSESREEKVNAIEKKLSSLAKLISEMEWTDHFKDKK